MDEKWVVDLTSKYQGEILAYLRRHTDNLEDAQDLCQDVFISVFNAKETFDPSKCDEKAWLYIITKNKLKNYYRDKKQFENIDDIYYDVTDGTDTVKEAAFLSELRDTLADALKSLDERSRAVITMRFFEEKSHKEIAEILGIGEGSVRMIQFRALLKLRKCIKVSNISDII